MSVAVTQIKKMKRSSVLVTAFSTLLVIIMSGMLLFTWYNYSELRDDQVLRQMKYLNQRNSPVNE